MKTFPRFVLAGLSLFTSAGTLATASEKPAVLPVGSAEVLNVGGGLILVVLAIVILGVVYARTQGLRSGKKGVISVIASQALGPKERIAIIEVADQQLLIGMTTGSVQTLHVFDQPVEVVSEAPRSFAHRLKEFMAGGAK